MPDRALFLATPRRTSGVTILLTADERRALNALARAAGLSTAEYVRGLIAREVSP